jgi:hypothetical protein
MSIAISDLIASAETIRTNNLPDSNTPELVGSTIKGALLLLQGQQTISNNPQYDNIKIVDANGLYIVDEKGYIKCQVTSDGPSGFYNSTISSTDLDYDITETIN